MVEDASFDGVDVFFPAFSPIKRERELDPADGDAVFVGVFIEPDEARFVSAVGPDFVDGAVSVLSDLGFGEFVSVFFAGGERG